MKLELSIRVESLLWIKSLSLNRGSRIIAKDCFGVEFCRIDLDGKSPAEVERLKDEAQLKYDRAILSTVTIIGDWKK